MQERLDSIKVDSEHWPNNYSLTCVKSYQFTNLGEALASFFPACTTPRFVFPYFSTRPELNST